MHLLGFCVPLLFVTGSLFEAANAQAPPDQSQSPAPPQASKLAQKPGVVTISLDDAIQLALQHNHNLLAMRTTIQQNQAEETNIFVFSWLAFDYIPRPI